MPNQSARHRDKRKGLRSRRATQRYARALGSVAAALSAMTIAPTQANAANWWYAELSAHVTVFSYQVGPPDPSYSGIRSVYAYADNSSHKVATGLAHYGQFAEGWYYACHPYADAHTDSPGLNNPHSVRLFFQAYWATTNVC